VAWGAGQYCQEHGINIPKDIGIVGFDNQAWAELHNPPLTTVNMNDYEMGYQAVKCVLDRLERPNAPTLAIRVATELLVRRSSVPS
jgi:DNA-binding LacI/PurR family transcriptional regulator